MTVAERGNTGKCRSQGTGNQHQQVMVAPLVSPLVREDRGQLRVVQGFDGRSGQHDRLVGSGQAVRGRFAVIDHHRAQPPVRAADGLALLAMPLAVPPRGDFGNFCAATASRDKSLGTS